MKIDIITLFPDMFRGPFDTSMLKKAQDMKLAEIKIHNLRKWAKNKNRQVDDRPYGGGPGMVLMIEPIYFALKDLEGKNSQKILLSPKGKVFNQNHAKKFSERKHLILICGHYEGFDERIRKNLVDEEISIGKYVLTGGEIPAMVLVDSVVRLLPGVLEKEAVESESFMKGDNFDYPVYTRPENFKGMKVPDVLLSGNHKLIKEWREKNS